MIRLLGCGILVMGLLTGVAAAAGPAVPPSGPPSGPSLGSAPGPALEALREQVAGELPPLWRLESFVLAPASPDSPQIKGLAKEASADTGDVTVVTAFTAVVSLSLATYTIESRRGPFTLLRPVAEPGLRKTLTGLIKSTWHDGRWLSRVGIANGFVTDGIGLPLDRFPGRTAVIGSPDAAKLVAELDSAAQQEAAAVAERQRLQQEAIAQQQAVTRVEAERIAAERAQIDQRAAALAAIKRQILEGERPARIAALEVALNGKDAAARAMAFSAALASRDPVVVNLALRNFFAQQKSLPVQLFATREARDSETVLANLGPLTLTIDRFDVVTGRLEGKLGAPGYSITLAGGVAGTLNQTELSVNSYGCALQLRLTEIETMDGLFRCQTLPALIARITLE